MSSIEQNKNRHENTNMKRDALGQQLGFNDPQIYEVSLKQTEII
jgi:hypothetical protein